MDAAGWQLLVQVVLAALGTLTLHIFSRLAGDFKSMAKTVEELKINTAVIATQQKDYQNRIDRLETFIQTGEVIKWKG